MNDASSQGDSVGPVRIAPVAMSHCRLALGCWQFGGVQLGKQNDADSMAVMEAALEAGINHFDTASGYGRSEAVVGEFIQGKRDRIFLASKQPATGDKHEYLDAIDASLKRLGTDHIELYYIHWPRSNMDLRPTMEALEEARSAGKVGAIGVSNFSIPQMEQISQAGAINAYQLCYNLVWRHDERELIPYCLEHDIALVSYSSIAGGALTGRFGPDTPDFPEDDKRSTWTYFRGDVWPHIHTGVQELQEIADEAGRSLIDLAIRWVAARPGITSVLVGARNRQQALQNAAAMDGHIPQDVFDRMTAVSDRIAKHVPDTGNIFGYYP